MAEKNIFQRAIDAVSNRDELEALQAQKAESERLQAEAEAARKQAEQLEIELATLKFQQAQAAEQAKMDAETQQAEENARAAEEAMQRAVEAQQLEAARLAELARKAATIKHVWRGDDTYASLAEKFYGSMKEPYWRLIYDYNKEIIGNHPNNIRVGLEIEIPPLPDELKKK